MAYESSQEYLKLFDPEQAPVWMQTLARRAGTPQIHCTHYLDMGCAFGHTTLALAALYPKMMFIGIDFNALHIGDASTQAQQLGVSNVHYVHADFCELPALPAAHMVTVRGIYSWLSVPVRTALEQAIQDKTHQQAILRVHYMVLPGSAGRDALGELFKAKKPQSVAEGRAIAQALIAEAPRLKRQLGNFVEGLEQQVQLPDALWAHDFLNEDFRAEYAHHVLARFSTLGFRFAAATQLKWNIPAIVLNPAIQAWAQPWHQPQTQTVIDIVTHNSSRSDLLVRGMQPNWAEGDYADDMRFGVVLPVHQLMNPVTVVNGTLKWENPVAQRLLAALVEAPRTIAELMALGVCERKALRDWIDLLWAGGKIAPFLTQEDAASLDLDLLARMNRDRLRAAMSHWSVETRVPLLAANYGNCLVAGWFECWALANFTHRHQKATQQLLLQDMRRRNMAFKDIKGRPAHNPQSVLRQHLERLEEHFISRMDYWGIHV